MQLGVIFQMRFGRVAAALGDLLRGGGLGPIYLADAVDKASRTPAYYASAAWRGTEALEGGGCLMTQSIHVLDLLQHLVGPIAAVTGRMATRRHAIEVEDTAAALLQFENGALGTLTSATSVRPALLSRLAVHGERGTVVANAQYDKFLVWRSRARPGRRTCPRPRAGGTPTTPGRTRRPATGCSFGTWWRRCARGGPRCSTARRRSARSG